MTPTQLKWHTTSVLAFAVAAAVHANAQEKNGQPPIARSPDADLEEVLVIGRFQQSLVNRIPIDPSELPFTLNVISRDFLNQRNFTRPIEALTTLPNITRFEDRQGTGTTNFISRGFSAPTLVDNRVQNNFRGSGARDDSFVERYEVLKGPASISTGPVGAGGVVNTVTKTPQAEQFVDLEFRGDEFGSLAGEIDANLGDDLISDAVLIRVNGAYRDFEFDANRTKRETKAIRPVAIFDLGAATSIRASVAYTKHDVNPNTGFPLTTTGGIPNRVDTGTFTGYANGEGEMEDLLYEAEVHHDFLDNLRLTVRGSKQDTDFDYQNTSGLYNYAQPPGLGTGDTELFAFPQRAKTASEATFADAQLAYQADWFGQQQDFVVGVAYDDRSFDRDFSDYVYDGPFQLDEVDEARYGPSASELGPVAPFTESDSELDSAFIEAALRPTDWLTILGDIRYDDLDQETVNYRRGQAFTSEYDDDETTFRLGATATVTDSINLYASYAEAFVPQFGVRRNDDPVDAERSDGYEVGAKGVAFDGRVSYQTGVFLTVRDDVSLPDPDNGPNEFFVVTAGEVEVKGFEFSGNATPVTGLVMTLNVGYTDIDVTEGQDDIQEPVFPEWTGSFYLSYEVQSGTLQGLRSGGGFRYVDDREGPLVDFDSYGIADLNVSYPINEDLTVAFDILNVTDEEYVENTSTNTVNRLTGGAVLGPPRTAVLTLRWSVL